MALDCALLVARMRSPGETEAGELVSLVAMLGSRKFDRRVAGFRGDVDMYAVRGPRRWAREGCSHLPQDNLECWWPGEKGTRAL